MFIDTSASMCCRCVCDIVSDYAALLCVFIETSVTMCCECVCAIVSDYASVCSLIQVRACIVSVCVPLLVSMLVCIH